jgi:hypothetical protein
MKKRTYTVRRLLVAIFALIWVGNAPTFGQSNALTVPQSIRLEHAAIIERLTKEAARTDATGVVAQKPLVFIKDHFAREEEFVFPPLGLLDDIAEGQLPDDATIKIAIEMAERTKKSRASFHEDHVTITSLMNELRESATKMRETDLVAFASGVAAHNLNEIEVVQPTTVMIGEYLQLLPSTPVHR